MGLMNWINEKLGKMSFNAKKRNDFYSQVISLNRAGMNRRDAIDVAWLVASKDGKKPKDVVALAITDIRRRLENGLTFGGAMEPWAPKDEVMVLNAIENSPDFATSLENYVALSVRRDKIKSSLIGGLVYPIFLFAGAFGLVVFFGTSLMPQLDAIYPMDKWTGAASSLKLMTAFAQNYVVISLITIIAIITAIIISLPRWAGHGRRIADKFPFYNIYKAYSGVNFLVAMSAMTSSGMKIMDALNNLIPRANPYVRHRLVLTRQQLMAGKNLGQALYDTKQDWPDANINLRLKIFAQTQDLSASMDKMSDESLTSTESQIKRFLGMLKNGMMLLVVGIVLILLVGIFSIQGQLGSMTNF